MKKIVLIYIFVCLVLLFSPFFGEAEDESDEIITLEEVVVTASKREQLTSEVPFSVSTIRSDKSDALRSTGMDVRFLSNRTPSLQMESSFGRVFPRFYIRGLGNTDFDLNASQPVSVLHDGIVFENAMLKGFPIFDIDRIEVLRGPQGTLFGRNTPAGAVKFESALPTETFEGYGRLGYGRFNTTNFEGVVSGPLATSALKARMSLLVQTRSDWVDNDYTAEENALGGHRDVAGRLQLLWTPIPRLEAWLKLHGRDLDGTARLFRANILKEKEGGLIQDFERGAVSQDGQNEQTLTSGGMAAKLRFDLWYLRLVSLTGFERLTTFSRGDIDGGYGATFAEPSGPGTIPFPSETASNIPLLRQFTQEVRLMSIGDIPFHFQLGAYYFHEFVEMEDFNYNTLAGGTLDGVAEQEQETKVQAAFGSISIKFTKNLEVGAGARISKDEKDYKAWRDQVPAVNAAAGETPLEPIYRSPDDSVWSGDLSMRYRLGPGVQTYVRVARGFRAPSIQGRLLFGNEVTVADTEIIQSLEFGTKLRLWEQRLHLNFGSYSYTMENQQLTAVGGGANFNRLINADNTLGRGVEAELTFLPMASLEISAGVSYNETRIEDPNLAVQGCGAPCNILDPPGSFLGTVSINGNSLPQAPKWIADITVAYVYELSSGFRLVASSDWSFRSRVQFFLYNSEEYSDEWLLEGGLKLACIFPDTKTEVALIGRNILNDTSPTGGIDFNNLTGYVNEPRFWSLELVRRF